MRPEKRPKPLAVCNVCHALTNRHESINHRCDQVLTGRRCYGTFKSAVNSLWDECEACSGTGQVGSQECNACRGFGWSLYA